MEPWDWTMGPVLWKDQLMWRQAVLQWARDLMEEVEDQCTKKLKRKKKEYHQQVQTMNHSRINCFSLGLSSIMLYRFNVFRIVLQDDDHDAEEWERYEALHEDVTKQVCLITSYIVVSKSWVKGTTQVLAIMMFDSHCPVGTDSREVV